VLTTAFESHATRRALNTSLWYEVGQHGVYCTSQRNPTVPVMDLRIINQELVHAKELVQSVMEELRIARQKEQS
jgi:hypothetical protein